MEVRNCFFKTSLHCARSEKSALPSWKRKLGWAMQPSAGGDHPRLLSRTSAKLLSSSGFPSMTFSAIEQHEEVSGMFIHEAVQQRTKLKPCIARECWNYPTLLPTTVSAKILPTNSMDGCIIYTSSDKNPRRGWQPTAGDLAADDWFVTSL